MALFGPFLGPFLSHALRLVFLYSGASHSPSFDHIVFLGIVLPAQTLSAALQGKRCMFHCPTWSRKPHSLQNRKFVPLHWSTNGG